MTTKLKTQKTNKSVAKFIDEIKDTEKRGDIKTLRVMFKKITGDDGAIWGDSIIGFGDYKYSNTMGTDIPWFRFGISPRAHGLSVYMMPGYTDQRLFKNLGKCKIGKCCINIKKLSDIDLKTLESIARHSLKSD